MQTQLARKTRNSDTTRRAWDTRRMAQRDLIAALRAFRRAEEKRDQTRSELDDAIREAVRSGEWQIVDIAEVTGWSRETIRKIANANT